MTGAITISGCSEWRNVRVSVALVRSGAVLDNLSSVRFSDIPTSCRCFRQEQLPQSRLTDRVMLHGFSAGLGIAQQLGA
jgi:hypothetical protein